MTNKEIIIFVVSRSLITVFILILIITGFQYTFKSCEKNQRLVDNLVAVNQPDESFQTKDDHPASKKQALDITPGELKTAFPTVITRLDNLYIKPQRTESFIELSSDLTIDIKAPVTNPPTSAGYRINNDTVPMRTLNFSDKWITIHAALGTDTGKIQVAAVDSIFTAIYHGRRRHPLLWIFSKRKLEVAATNRSPYIKIKVLQAGTIKH